MPKNIDHIKPNLKKRPSDQPLTPKSDDYCDVDKTTHEYTEINKSPKFKKKVFEMLDVSKDTVDHEHIHSTETIHLRFVSHIDHYLDRYWILTFSLSIIWLVDDYIRLNRRTVKTITNTNRKGIIFMELRTHNFKLTKYGTELLNMHSKEMTIIIKNHLITNCFCICTI